MLTGLSLNSSGFSVLSSNSTPSLVHSLFKMTTSYLLPVSSHLQNFLPHPHSDELKKKIEAIRKHVHIYYPQAQLLTSTLYLNPHPLCSSPKGVSSLPCVLYYILSSC